MPGAAPGPPGRTTDDGRARRRHAASVSAGLATRIVEGGRPTPYAARVLDLVERIPRGKVMSYGDVAEFVGKGSGRSVGATTGSGVPE